MVTVIELGPHGIPPPGSVQYTLMVNGIPHRLAFLEMLDVEPAFEVPVLEQLRTEPGEPEYWH